MCGRLVTISREASKPVILGMPKSKIAMPGLNSLAFSIASLPLLASATTFQPGLCSRTTRTPRRLPRRSNPCEYARSRCDQVSLLRVSEQSTSPPFEDEVVGVQSLKRWRRGESHYKGLLRTRNLDGVASTCARPVDRELANRTSRSPQACCDGKLIVSRPSGAYDPESQRYRSECLVAQSWEVRRET